MSPLQAVMIGGVLTTPGNRPPFPTLQLQERKGNLLKQDAVPTRAIHSGGVSVSDSAWELAGLRKFLPWLEGGIAGRFVTMNKDLQRRFQQCGYKRFN